ncbi:Flavodoxin reductases (ferredoxin-NADPH reductases) family 1; Vanillate O-demethylase oxidoreductase (plasmid) [Klebsiella aerogenes]|nr:Flavodoxin reductases (ferredoxin-NADPH reductases) family 1; Vanillate O-demethylase oxidoreductase [Klebsiella aerogenes]
MLSSMRSAPRRGATRVDIHISALGSRLDLSRLFADIEPGTHIYTCGPQRLTRR